MKLATLCKLKKIQKRIEVFLEKYDISYNDDAYSDLLLCCLDIVHMSNEFKDGELDDLC